MVAVFAVALGGCPLLVGLDGEFREVAVTVDGAVVDPPDGAPPARVAVGITAGARHTCAWFEDGEAACWGNNGGGRLGDGTVETRATPVRVTGLAGKVKMMAAGGVHTCALLADARVQCWGTNDEGQLGDGTTTSSLAPVSVPNLQGVVHVSAGALHGCAVAGSGVVRCWGSRGPTSAAPGAPDAGSGGGAWRTVASGAGHSCAASFVGVQCWGVGDGVGERTHARQLTGPTEEEPDIPVTFAAPTALAAGAAHACASFGGVPGCWGANFGGQLGDGTTTLRPKITVVAVGDQDASATAFAAGSAHTCMIRAPGHLHCFGLNDAGQLGPATEAEGADPAPSGWRGPGANVRAVAAGADHTCALVEDGTVWCWGANEDGQLGDGTRASRATPGRVSL